MRIIPVLLLKDRGVHKTVKFSKPKYIGDPINSVKIFNDKEVDEIIILDIEASKKQSEPDYEYLKDLCSEAFMPLAYGGGITSVEQAKRLFQIGVEKVIVNTSLLNNMSLLTSISQQFGAQSVVASIDYKKQLFGGVKPQFLSATKSKNTSLVGFAKECEQAGAGEVMLQSIERDGTFLGLDKDAIRDVSAALTIPLIACGGLNSLEDALSGILAGASAIAGGSFFVYKNNNTESILINYPVQKELETKIYRALNG